MALRRSRTTTRQPPKMRRFLQEVWLKTGNGVDNLELRKERGEGNASSLGPGKRSHPHLDAVTEIEQKVPMKLKLTPPVLSLLFTNKRWRSGLNAPVRSCLFVILETKNKSGTIHGCTKSDTNVTAEKKMPIRRASILLIGRNNDNLVNLNSRPVITQYWLKIVRATRLFRKSHLSRNDNSIFVGCRMFVKKLVKLKQIKKYKFNCCLSNHQIGTKAPYPVTRITKHFCETLYGYMYNEDVSRFFISDWRETLREPTMSLNQITGAVSIG